jgi:hypothetical protein
MITPSFTYDNKIITVTHDMALHITNVPDGTHFQKVFYKNSFTDTSDTEPYFLELVHIIFTKLIAKVPDNVAFKLYTLEIPSCMIPYVFARDAFDILKPLIVDNPKTRSTFEQYFMGERESREWEQINSPYSSDSDER